MISECCVRSRFGTINVSVRVLGRGRPPQPGQRPTYGTNSSLSSVHYHPHAFSWKLRGSGEDAVIVYPSHSCVPDFYTGPLNSLPVECSSTKRDQICTNTYTHLPQLICYLCLRYHCFVFI